MKKLRDELVSSVEDRGAHQLPYVGLVTFMRNTVKAGAAIERAHSKYGFVTVNAHLDAEGINRAAMLLAMLAATHAPVAPKVPDEMTKHPDGMASQQFVDGWNACREAMLSAKKHEVTP